MTSFCKLDPLSTGMPGRMFQRGYVGGFGVLVVAVVLGLVAAWGMGATPKDVIDLNRPRISRSTPAAGELADRANHAAAPRANIDLVGHPLSASLVTATFRPQGGTAATVTVHPRQTVRLDLPRGDYTLSIVSASEASRERAGAVAAAYDVELTAAGLVVDLGRQRLNRLPFPFGDK